MTGDCDVRAGKCLCGRVCVVYILFIYYILLNIIIMYVNDRPVT